MAPVEALLDRTIALGMLFGFLDIVAEAVNRVRCHCRITNGQACGRCGDSSTHRRRSGRLAVFFFWGGGAQVTALRVPLLYASIANAHLQLPATQGAAPKLLVCSACAFTRRLASGVR